MRSLAAPLSPTVELVAVYYQQRFCLLSLAELAVFLLDLEEAARAKLLRPFPARTYPYRSPSV